MASCSDGAIAKTRQITHSDELLHLPFKPENSKLLITKERKLEGAGLPNTYKVEPSSVLTRVKDFLPKMKEAKELLENELRVKSTCELDIENVGDNTPYIEMSLALMETQDDSGDDSCNESNENGNEDSDDIKTQEIDCGQVTEDNFVISRTLKGHVKPVIEEISTEKRNSLKKNSKKRNTSKKGSKKRKQR